METAYFFELVPMLIFVYTFFLFHVALLRLFSAYLPSIIPSLATIVKFLSQTFLLLSFP